MTEPGPLDPTRAALRASLLALALLAFLADVTLRSTIYRVLPE